MKKKLKMLLLILTTFGGAVYGGHSTLDKVDPGFAPLIQTNLFTDKWVSELQTLPDGKILALGSFNSYNRVPVGKLIRLNPDGSLDPTFYAQTITSIAFSDTRAQIFIQPDGKIIVKGIDMIFNGQGAPKNLVRLNPNGTLDTSFNFTPIGFIYDAALDSLGRIAIAGSFTTPQGSRTLVRVNPDGSLDTSFNFTPGSGVSLESIAAQGSRLIVSVNSDNNRQIYRLNEDGSPDSSFTPVNQGGSRLIVQPDNKILYLANNRFWRLNENGGNDDGFQSPTFTTFGAPVFKLGSDGKIVVTSRSSSATFRRFLPDGAIDSSFNQYTPPSFASFAIQSDGGILIGDGILPFAQPGFNYFLRLTPDGVPDPAFNPGGSGFQSVLPGSVASIAPQPDGKILIGGNFDLINDVPRSKIARLNADSMVDASFQVNTNATGNYFSMIREIYQIRAQSDGKIVVSGWFDYVLNGESKRNLARLNSDGSIDETFNLTHPIPDYSQIILGGMNRFAIFDDGNLLVGTSKGNVNDTSGPVKLSAGGARDTTFNPTINSGSSVMFIEDVAIQPDGKILIGGSHRPPPSSSPLKSFVARLNPDGSTDPTFIYSEEQNLMRINLVLLPNGKILVGKNLHPGGGSARLQRLNSDGSPDTSFNSLLLPNSDAKIHALLSLPNGKIFVGGKFTFPINGGQTKNLLRLDADGNFESTIYNLNEEVLTLAADHEGRVLVGGGFTVIDTNGGEGAKRTYIARLTDSPRFDFDGDGRSDTGAFSDADGVWKIWGSLTNQNFSIRFGLSGDKTTAADFDGDGRADIAVFRPSDGVWYLLRSRDGFLALHWGMSGDQPVAGDYDGDGRADSAVFRPSSAVWYILPSSNQQPVILKFGLTGDVPLPEVDFDGDGKTDIAVWRPSDGNFYWLASGEANQFRAVHFGTNGDIPAAADYNGDGKTDLVVYRPTEGNWYQYLSAPNGGYIFAVIRFGLDGDTPVPADYDGDGKTDIAVRRDNIWHILRSTEGYTAFAFAEASDTAIPAMPLP